MITQHQEAKAREILEQLVNNKRGVLNGSAGVGKTYLANEIIKRLKLLLPRHKEIYVSAPTNKAVAVIKNKVEQIDGLSFITTHSALKMKRQINNKTGEVSFTSYASEKYPALKGVGLLVIDEASMLNTQMLRYVEEFAAKQNVRVLFIGDDKQLNPVKEKESPVFLGEPFVFDTEEAAMKFKEKSVDNATFRHVGDEFIVHIPYPTVTLTEIIRQGEGNPIIDLSRNIIDIWNHKTVVTEWGDEKFPGKRTEVGGYIYSYDRDRVIETLAAVNGSDDLKYLAWTNSAVNTMNDWVRVRLYGQPKLVELGESLIFDAPYGRDVTGASLYFTNEEIKVEELTVMTKKFMYPVKSNNITGEYESNPITLKVYCINPGEKGLQDGVAVVHEDSKQDFANIVRQMKSNCKARVLEWVDYFAFTEQFADIKYNHAITVHKSQGSTYKQAILNVRDINRNRSQVEKSRLFYTAVTRASDLLILFNV